MMRLTQALAGCLLLTAGALAEDLTIDFERDFAPVAGTPGRPSRVTGELCPPLVENSSGWADVDIHFERLTTETNSGAGTQRISVRAVRDGRAQIWVNPVTIPPGTYGQLRVALRAPHSGSVGLGLRMTGEPWRFHWQETYVCSPEWREFVSLIPPLPASDQRTYALMLMLEPGVIDVDDLSLRFVPESELIGDAPPATGNLLPHSSFPAGLVSPWSLAWHQIGASAVADPAEPGPSGLPSLRLECGRSNNLMPREVGVELTSPALALNPSRHHTVSLWARGSRPGQTVLVKVGGVERNWLQRTLTLDTTWRRYETGGQVPLLLEGFAVMRLASSDPLWVDGLQLTEGTEAGEPMRHGGIELGLQAVAPRGLHLAGEALAARAVVCGPVPAGATLRGTLVPVEGARRAVGPIPVSPGDLAVVPLELAPGVEPALGTYRLELRLHNAAGEPISDWAELILHRVRPPRAADRDAPDSPFGIHINALDDEAAVVKRLGFNWVRVHDAAVELTKWYFLEPETGGYDWTDADAGVALFRRHKLKILGMVDTCPPQYSAKPEDDRGWFGKYYLPLPEHLDRWAEYGRLVASRYRDQIDCWEVWNEPYIKSFFRLRSEGSGAEQKVVSGTPVEYLGLLRPAFAAVRSGAPEARVIWASQAGDWHDGCVAGGAAEFADVVSYHAYLNAHQLGWPDFERRVASLRAGLPEPRRGLPIQNSEGGAGASSLQHILVHTPPANKDGYTRMMAEFLVRYQLASLASGTERFFLYTYHKWAWRPDWNLRLPDGSLAPNATSQSNLFWHVEGKRYSRTLDLGDGFRALLFEHPDETVAVVLRTAPGAADWPRPAGATVRDLYGNDVPAGATLGHGIWYLTAARATEATRLLQP